MSARHTTRRGYTMVELMMALAVFAIGVSGIMAMHKVIVAANQHAKNLAIATHIAQAWQEQLAADAAQWNHPSPRDPGRRDIDTDTTWLAQVVGNANTWIRPTFNATRDFGPMFDALGNVVPQASEPQAQFCSHIRLSWLYNDGQPTPGNGLIRAEVRVFWLREGQGALGGTTLCDPNGVANAIGAAIERYHFVYKTTAVRQNTAI
jgi:prepilin-type N-terminal cleavage/methylation domain-containing protein